MENKLTLREIAPYLPYGLTAEMLDYKKDYVGKRYDEIVGVHQWDKNHLHWSILTIGGSKPSIDRIKPILRPLSDIIKEIEHNGERFIPNEIIKSYNPNFYYHQMSNYIREITETCIIEYEYGAYPFWLIELMCEWHIDFQGLIDKGLAIDINTLSVKNEG